MHGSILDEIVASRHETFKIQAADNYKAFKGERRSFIKTLRQQRGQRVCIIGEIKNASPSHGCYDMESFKERINAYANLGLEAISILTEPRFFKGSYHDLVFAVNNTNLPILCKDFIIYKAQLDLIFRIGASMALIIACIPDSLRLINYCLNLGLEPLIEIHDVQDLKKVVEAINANPENCMIGINNRDLSTFKINLENTRKLIPKVRKMLGSDTFIISESGVKNSRDVEFLMESGADALLIGTRFMTASLQELPYIIKEFNEIRRFTR
ncbi:MAG: indole-3-glycerol-phosphate synthase [Promethearchaeota archaeon]